METEKALRTLFDKLHTAIQIIGVLNRCVAEDESLEIPSTTAGTIDAECERAGSLEIQIRLGGKEAVLKVSPEGSLFGGETLYRCTLRPNPTAIQNIAAYLGKANGAVTYEEIMLILAVIYGPGPLYEEIVQETKADISENRKFIRRFMYDWKRYTIGAVLKDDSTYQCRIVEGYKTAEKLIFTE